MLCTVVYPFVGDDVEVDEGIYLAKKAGPKSNATSGRSPRKRWQQRSSGDNDQEWVITDKRERRGILLELGACCGW